MNFLKIPDIIEVSCSQPLPGKSFNFSLIVLEICRLPTRSKSGPVHAVESLGVRWYERHLVAKILETLWKDCIDESYHPVLYYWKGNVIQSVMKYTMLNVLNYSDRYGQLTGKRN